MKKGYYKFILLSFLIVFLINFISAQNLIDKTNLSIISGTHDIFYKTLDKNESNLSIITKPPMKSSMRLSSSSINTITVIWPEPGYYYITDALLLEITTANPSSCTYTFNGVTNNMIDNQTEHYKPIYGLTDNMASDTPYIIDFNCNDGFATTSTSTYFKINTTELDKYLIRNKFGDWNYLSSERNWNGNDEGLIEVYSAYYNPDNIDIYDRIKIFIYDSRTSLETNVKNKLLPELGSNIPVQTINGKNFYVFTDSGDKYLAWTSGNYFITNWAYSYKNITAVSVQIPNEIINPYLAKYPNDLRYGICGDSKVNVLNLDGKTEQCDKNSETISCGSNIGECKIGQKKRLCKSDCTWGDYGVCNATQPKTEICDGKDNNCDGKIDETFTLLGQTCNVGVGICKQEGKYICSASGTNVACNAIAKTPEKENCNDGIDNDCDGLIDFNDNLNCIPLKINSPINKFNYSDKKILLDITSDFNPNDITISYFDNRGKEVTMRLCSKCNNYNKTKLFNDGFYNITIAIGNKSQIFSKKQLSFLVDSTSPKISETFPKKGFTNGNFSIEFKEDNPKTLILNFDNQKKNIDLIKECNIDKGVRYCNTKVNLASLEGKEILYYFNLTDITGKNISSKPIKLTVDTILPKVKINWTSNKGKVNFILNVTETHFDEITYIDSSDIKPREVVLCLRLKNNMCEISKNFKIGPHNLTIYTKDEAGNILKNQVNFII